MTKIIRFPAMLVVLFFIFTPFTWSYISNIGGFLLRPLDVVSIIMIVVTLIHGNIIIPQKGRIVVGLFLVLIGWILLNSIITDEAVALLTVGKILFYLLASISVASWLVKLNFSIPKRLFVWPLVFIFLFIVVTRPQVFDAISNLSYHLIARPDYAFHLFWHEIFNINFFGPSGEIIIKGVSFRNTASLGFLSIALFSYGFVKPGTLNKVLFYVFNGLAIVCLSRTGILSVLFFLSIVLGTIKTFRARITFIAILVLTSLSFVNSIFAETVGGRFSESSARGKYIVDGLKLFSEQIIWGLGSEAKVVSAAGFEKTIHNVPLALGTQFGIVALFVASLIIFFNFSAMVYFAKCWLRARDFRERQLYTIFIVAAFVITIRPNLSASAQNFYSYSEWACFSLVLAGLSLKSSNFNVR